MNKFQHRRSKTVKCHSSVTPPKEYSSSAIKLKGFDRWRLQNRLVKIINYLKDNGDKQMSSVQDLETEAGSKGKNSGKWKENSASKKKISNKIEILKKQN